MNRELNTRDYLLAAFLEGAAVLSAEILGAKILTPFFGNSLTVWTSVIGVTITFLTIGYYVGGLLSKKQHLRRLLSLMLSLAAVCIIMMPSWATSLFDTFSDSGLYSGTILTTCLLLGPSMFALGTTSPIIIQQLTSQLNDSGRKAGVVYAISTLGGICFIFLFGFLIIPFIGISIPLAVLSLAVLLFALYIFKSKIHIAFGIVYILFMLKVVQMQKTDEGTDITISYMTEGLMGQIKVMDKKYPGSNASYRHLMVNGVPESIVTNDKEAISGWPYVHKLAILTSMKKDPNILLFGFGGGSLATEFNRMKLKTDVVEIDGRLLDVAKNYFYFSDSLITYTTDDARHYMRTSKKQYDIIAFDVFTGEVIPSYVFTTEGIVELKSMLKPGGIIFINFNELLDPDKTSAYQSICNTLLTQGYKVYCKTTTDEIAGVLIAASLNDIDFSHIDKSNINKCCSIQPWTDEFIKNPVTKVDKPFEHGIILTDDKPVMEILSAATLKKWRQWVIENYTSPMLKQDQKIFR